MMVQQQTTSLLIVTLTSYFLQSQPLLISLSLGLTQADLENYHTGNGTSSGVDSDEDDGDSVKMEEDELKEEAELLSDVPAPKHVLTTFELEGLSNLLGKLEELPPQKKCVPAGIRNPAALLHDMRVCVALSTVIQVCFIFSCNAFHCHVSYCPLCLYQAVLKKHANDDPKLSYTGEPIVKWPERVRKKRHKQHTHAAGWGA